MDVQFCRYRLEVNVKLVNAHSSFITFYCVINLAFSLVAILGNLLAVYALWKASSIPATLRKLFLSLAVSDVAVGVFAQLTVGVLSAVMLHMEANGNYNFNFLCSGILTAHYFCLFFLACASFLNLAAIAVDRLLSIALHLRYQELVTSNRVVITLVTLWLTSCVAASIFTLIPNHGNMVNVITGVFGVIVTSAAYVYIFKVVRYHRNQIKKRTKVRQDRSKVHRDDKSTINVMFVFVVFLICHLPNLLVAIFVEPDKFRTTFLVFNHCTVFLVLLNSSLNPIIYCWRYREIRSLMKNRVKKMCPFT